MSTNFIKMICRLMIVCLLGVTMPVHAAIMPTDSVTPASSAERARVAAFLGREDVRKELQANGVSPEAAMERARALSDDEVRQLAGKIDGLPAGADGGSVLGLIFTVFIVLLITDILGFTKVFPFTRSIR